MGNGTSKAIDALPNLAPKPLPGGFPAEPDLSRTDLRQVLAWTAQYIAEHSKDSITIIAVGGVVNTISLRSRSSTHDIDWFNNGLSKDLLLLLGRATTYALEQAQRRKNENHFELSLRQNYEVFSAPGLRVLAAPWGYALMTKFDRMAGGGGKPYDPDDAANYLHQYLKQLQRPKISVHEINQMAKKFRLRLRVQDINTVNQRYRAKFGQLGIVG